MTEHETAFDGTFAAWAKAWEFAGAEDGPFALAFQALDPRRWLGLVWGAAEQPFETILGLPRLAAFPALDRKALALVGGWLLLQQRSGEHGAMVCLAWSEAYVEFLAELNRTAAEGHPVKAGRELLDRWRSVLNRKLQRVQRSDKFLSAQRKMLDALLSSRAREREVIEAIANAFDLPTRTELDDAHGTLHNLKREVRALRRELESVKANAAGASPPAKPAPQPRAPGRRLAGARAKGGGNGAPRPA
jgi:polyhydroxyalkanoate synthase subunit PhaE